MNQFLKGNWFKVFIAMALIAVSFSVGLLVRNKSELENPVSCEDIAIELEEKYQDTSAIKIDGSIDNYEKFLTTIDKQCPFISTAFTSECLDRLISKKETELKNLITETTKQAQVTKEEVNRLYGSYPEIDFLLSKLPEYNKTWQDYSELFCAVVVSSEGGSGIVEASRKCKLFQIEQYIQLLEDQEDWIRQ